MSVIILTCNEQANIADCLRSCAWCDDVHVVDSGSTDRTIEIAAAMGATVHRHAFKSFGQQRNWAIDHIACRHTWQFHLDADERFTEPLLAAVMREIGFDGTASTKSGYHVPSRLMFFDTWLRRSGDYPAWQVRLIRPHRCRFVDAGPRPTREDARRNRPPARAVPALPVQQRSGRVAHEAQPLQRLRSRRRPGRGVFAVER